MLSRGGVYEIINTIDGKKYVGSASNFTKRFCVHKCQLRKNTHHARYMQHAWNKYGELAFVFKPIVICERPYALGVEQKLIDTKNYVYNVHPIARGGREKGYIASIETRRKLSAAGKGRVVSNEVRQKIGLANSGAKGHKRTVEHKLAISLANKNKVVSVETRKKLSKAKTERVVTSNTIAKISRLGVFSRNGEEFRGTYKEFSVYIGLSHKLNSIRASLIRTGNYAGWSRSEVIK